MRVSQHVKGRDRTASHSWYVTHCDMALSHEYNLCHVSMHSCFEFCWNFRCGMFFFDLWLTSEQVRETGTSPRLVKLVKTESVTELWPVKKRCESCPVHHALAFARDLRPNPAGDPGNEITMDSTTTANLVPRIYIGEQMEPVWLVSWLFLSGTKTRRQVLGWSSQLPTLTIHSQLWNNPAVEPSPSRHQRGYPEGHQGEGSMSTNQPTFRFFMGVPPYSRKIGMNSEKMIIFPWCLNVRPMGFLSSNIQAPCVHTPLRRLSNSKAGWT